MSSDHTIYGHSLSGHPKNEWEPLEDHLKRVASGFAGKSVGSCQFASAFDAAIWGQFAGLWHDIGKYADAFQQYICKTDQPGSPRTHGPDHATAGAQLAHQLLGNEGLLFAYAIAGHHGGLPDWSDHNGGRSGLKDRLEKSVPEIADALARVPDWLREKPSIKKNIPRLFDGIRSRSDPGLRVAMFVRMLFSCLVDADYLATEYFLDPARTSMRLGRTLNTEQCLVALDAHLAQLNTGTIASAVNQHRAVLLSACREHANDEPGLFSLTAPTGSGKTLSSLAFALEHARKHNLRRIIYALPYTSITEQTAQVFNEVFKDLGNGIILEHHSAADWKMADENESQTDFNRLAAENWDAPIIVTTNVQLLESLFASRTGKCRKLHRLVNSVVILDEAQALPVHLLKPTLTALDELTRGYGSSVVLCSATMPALTHREGFDIGLRDVREIVPDPASMSRSMCRVKLTKPGIWTDAQLLDALEKYSQALVIVNTKAHAAAVFSELRDRMEISGVFHLSAAMCAVHRSQVLGAIKDRLCNAAPCLVISTQVIEAGVDIDFPVVFRAMAGLDSIAQAAGRCNREGTMDKGEVIVFETNVKPPPMVRQQAQTAKEIGALHDDLLSLEAIEHYFRLHLWQQKNQWDKDGIADRNMFDINKFMFQFREAAAKYRVIKDQTTPIVVPFGEQGQALCDQLLASPFLDRQLLRRVQRFSVGVYDHQLKKLLATGACEAVHDQIFVLIDELVYDKELGLRPDATTDLAERLII